MIARTCRRFGRRGPEAFTISRVRFQRRPSRTSVREARARVYRPRHAPYPPLDYERTGTPGWLRPSDLDLKSTLSAAAIANLGPRGTCQGVSTAARAVPPTRLRTHRNARMAQAFFCPVKDFRRLALSSAWCWCWAGVDLGW